MKRQTVIVTVAQGASWLIAAAAGSVLPPFGFSTIAIAVILLVGLGVTVAVTLWQLSIANRDQGKELHRLRTELRQNNAALCRANIDTLLAQLTKIVGKTGLITRSCLFLIGSEGMMYIAQHHNMDGAPDLGIRLVRLQGCTGHAWGLKEQTVADLSSASDTDLTTTWKLTAEQIAITRGVKSILSTPVRLPSDIIIGILSIDSNGSLQESDLDNPDVMDTAVESAEALARLLQMGDIATGGSLMELQ